MSPSARPSDRSPLSLASAPAVDAPTTMLGAAYLSGLNQLVANVQPLLLGALARDYGLSDRQLGHVSAVYIGAITTCTLTAPFWIRRVNWRLFASAAIVACVLAFAWGATLRTPSMFLLLFLALGLFKGGFGAPAFACLGDSSNPDRSYALSSVLQGLLAAAAAAPVASFIIPKYGVAGLFVFLGATYATGIAGCLALPRAGRVPSLRRNDDGSAAPLLSTSALPPAAAALASATFTAGVLSFWYFVERIGVARGVPAAFIGVTISVTALAGILTSGVNIWLGGRLPSLAFVAAGTVLLLASYAVLAAPGDTAFLLCNLLFALGWGFASPAYWAIVRTVDATGRLFVAAPAASGAAGVGVGLIAGPVIEHGGYQGLLIFSAALFGLAFCGAATIWRSGWGRQESRENAISR